MFERGIRFDDIKKIKVKPNLGIGLILLGFALVFITPIYKETLNTKPSLPNYQQPKLATSEVIFDPIRPSKQFSIKDYRKEELPKKILISSVGIDLAITPARVLDGFWEVSENSANFGLGSAPPGKKGNTVIFAHSRWGIFGNLYKIKKDAEIDIKTENQLFTYKVSDIKEISPSQINVIAPTIDKTLTLYTCSGFADSKRLVVQAKLVNTNLIE